MGTLAQAEAKLKAVRDELDTLSRTEEKLTRYLLQAIEECGTAALDGVSLTGNMIAKGLGEDKEKVIQLNVLFAQIHTYVSM